MKTCHYCQQTKPLSDFSPHKETRDGHTYMCNVCNRAKVKKWAEENPDKVKAARRRIVESGMKAVYAKRDYAKHRNNIIARVKVWVSNHREKHGIHAKNWQSKNRVRVSVLSQNYQSREHSAVGSYSYAEWKTLCDRYGNVCVCCKKHTILSADHVIPLSKGGSNTIDNIQPLCHSCNSRKHNKIIDYRL